MRASLLQWFKVSVKENLFLTTILVSINVTKKGSKSMETDQPNW